MTEHLRLPELAKDAALSVYEDADCPASSVSPGPYHVYVAVDVMEEGVAHVTLTLLPSLMVNDVTPFEPVTVGFCTCTESRFFLAIKIIPY